MNTRKALLIGSVVGAMVMGLCCVGLIGLMFLPYTGPTPRPTSTPIVRPMP